jgi:hypothetical protein
VDSTNNRVGVGTTTTLAENGGRSLTGSSGTGFEYFAVKDDTLIATGEFVGAYLFGSTDLSGTPNHYAGMWAKAADEFGAMDIHFAADRDQYEADSPHMTLDSSGNLLVGTTTTDVGSSAGFTALSTGLMANTVSGGVVSVMNRLSTDGEILRFRKDGTTVGSIGVDSSRITLTSSSRTWFWGSSNYFVDVDNVVDLGSISFRFDDIYATNGTIQTSDRNEKQDIAELDEAEKRVAVACKGLIRKYRWKDAVAEKGDAARIHVGIIAQDLQDAFAAEGLDAHDYAMFISATWWEHDGQTYETAEEAPEGAVEKTRLGVRYPELLAFIIGAL